MSRYTLLSRVSRREVIMLAALVLVGFLIWLSALGRNWDDANRKLRQARRELARQAVWLGNAERFDRELKATLSRLDPAATLEAAALTALLDDLAREHGLKHELGAAVTKEEAVFSQHSLRVSVKNAPLADLIAFERALRTHYPYATLEAISISANKNDPRLLNARLTVGSFELRDRPRNTGARLPERKNPESNTHTEEAS